MTTFLEDMTADEETSYLFQSSTGLFSRPKDEKSRGITSRDVDELSERVEMLVNKVGQLHTELLERPNKWVTQIRDLGDENYELVEPILIVIEEYSDDSVIARFPEIEVFGEGVTDSEAIINLKNSILDLYDELTETDSDMLGKLPKAWLRIIERIIAKN